MARREKIVRTAVVAGETVDLTDEPVEAQLVVAIEPGAFDVIAAALCDAGRQDLVLDFARKIVATEVCFIKRRD